MASKAVTAHEPGAEVTDLSGGLLAVIATAARDPNVDVDKMERLLNTQERVLARQAKASYDTALAELQPKLPIITERGKILNKQGGVQSTFAFWEDINEIIRPLLHEHGFSLSFKSRPAGNMVVTIGILAHRDGHREETEVELPRDDSGNKNSVQGIGSSKSYGKRYAAFDLLNITTKGEDDDGATASSRRPDGEPMPRTKLDGPHPSKTALRNAVNGIIAEVRAAPSNEAITAILKREAPTLKQAEKDWPTLISGDPKIPEDIGLRGTVEQARALFVEDGQFQTMLTCMRRNQTRLALDRWRGENEDYLDTLDGAEARIFQAEWDKHEAGINAMDQVSA